MRAKVIGIAVAMAAVLIVAGLVLVDRTDESAIAETKDYLVRKHREFTKLLYSGRDAEIWATLQQLSQVEFALELIDGKSVSDFDTPAPYGARFIDGRRDGERAILLQLNWLESGFRTRGFRLLDSEGVVVSEWEAFIWDEPTRRTYERFTPALVRRDVICVELDGEMPEYPDTMEIYVLPMDTALLQKDLQLELYTEDGNTSEAVDVFIPDSLRQSSTEVGDTE